MAAYNEEIVPQKKFLKTLLNLRKIFFLLVLLFIFKADFAAAQNGLDPYQSPGFKKYITNYRLQDSNQLWANHTILQDKQGIIYVVNLHDRSLKGKLQQYDGVSWRTIKGYESVVYSMAMDDTGNIYIGGNNEIGLFKPDTQGSLKYEPLMDYLAENKKNFGFIESIHSTPEGIYFSSSKFLFRWDTVSRTFKVWESPPNERFLYSLSYQGKLFVHVENTGLTQMVKDELKTVPWGKEFKEKIITIMVRYDDKTTLMGTQSSGLYLLNGTIPRPFPTQVDHYLENNRLEHGIRLSTGDFALATSYDGLIIIDAHGKLKEKFNKASDLQDEEVNYVFEDKQGNLWLALEQGIAKIEYLSPVSFNNHLSLNIFALVKHRNILYAGTERGVFSLTPGGEFLQVAGISGFCLSLLLVDDSVFAATSQGVYQLGITSNIKLNGDVTFCLLRSSKDPNRIWAGGRKGLNSFYKQKNQWILEHKFEKITQTIQTIAEDKKGNLWIGINFQRKLAEKAVLKVDFPAEGTITSPLVTGYDFTPYGLTPNRVWVLKAAGRVIFSTDKGLFRYDEKNNAFIPDLTLGHDFAGGSGTGELLWLVEDKNKNIWFYTRNWIRLAKPRRDGSFIIYAKPFNRIQSYYWFPVYPDPGNDITWIGGKGNIIRYDMNIEKNYDDEYPTLIRKVMANGKPVFGDYKNGIGNEYYAGGSFPLIPYADRNLSFEFAAPFFEDETRTQYRFFLEGYETDWSPLNWETRKDYTNLPPGLYTFKAQAENVYGSQSSEAVFKFKILLPWYRTWWAFLSYTLVLLSLIYLIVKWRRSIKLGHEKQKLEQIVAERTKEIIEKSLQLEQKTIQLEEQSEKLKEIDQVKSRFFANISHEFRTPLTLIMGPLEQMLSKNPGKEEEKRLNLMLRNSQRLLGLINQLLVLSKFDSGKMKLHASRQNIIPFLKGITATFETIAYKNQLDLIFHSEEENITLYFDPEKLEEVFLNLLSNAVKFTPAGGKITVAVFTAQRQTAAGADSTSSWLELAVSDSGTGIPGEQLKHIFDRFYQSDNTYEHHRKGSGIGLAIAKELIELHHGEIEARNCVEKGTEFIIRLPRGDSHLQPEEVAGAGAKFYRYRSINEIPAFYGLEKESHLPAGAIFGKTGSSKRPLAIDDVEPTAPVKDIILIVEDNADVREYIRGALEPLYTVLEARDGQDGMQKALEIIPDLIISDIMMPGKDGYELCRVLKNDTRTCHIPLILLTAKASEENIIRGLETGADDYITKPFSTKILCARITNLLELRRQLQLKRKRQMTLEPIEISVSSMDKEFYKELQEVLERNLEDPEFNVDRMGKKLYMSRATLYRKIMGLIGESPQLFIRSYRLKRAAQLLKSNYGNVNEVAAKVGFSNPAYFSQCFKEQFHCSPSTYQSAETGS